MGAADTRMMRPLRVLLMLGLLASCGRNENGPATAPATTAPASQAAEIPSPPEHATRGSVADRVAYYGPAARSRLVPQFAKAGVAYPPNRVVMLALKNDRRLELYAESPAKPLTFICTYPILAASGQSGPKLREGDRQVPEGIYAIESLNPNSSYHLSLRVGYPNAFDRQMAAADDRTNLGGDIMIHGKSASVGCLAMGDPAAEDLFVLAAETGISHITLLITPCDLRREPPATLPTTPAWTETLYAELRKELQRLPTPNTL
jgi:hypothetical protein